MHYQIYKRNYQPIAREDQECYTLVEYLELKGLKYSHIHHEMFTTSMAQRSKAKRLGVKSGLPDYIICLPGKLLFIEMKRKKNSHTSKEQHEWINALNSINGVCAYVAHGFDEAKIIIDKHLTEV
jgi:hypothetical protein